MNKRLRVMKDAQNSVSHQLFWNVLSYIKEEYPNFWEKNQKVLDPEKSGVYHHLDPRYQQSEDGAKRRRNFLRKLQNWFYGAFKCEHCGALVCELKQYKSFPRPHPRWCSQSCSKANDDAVEARERTSLKKYGYKNVAFVPKFRKKISEAIKNTDMSQRWIDIQDTLVKKHGSVEEAFKIRREKTNATNLRRYGNICAVHGKEQRKKCLATWRENLGVDNPSKSPEVYDKIVFSRMKFRKVVKCGKRIHHLQGYEPQAMDFMISKLGIKPKNIWSKKGEVPTIDFVYKGSSCKYYPDFKILSPLGNTYLVEVKSGWTLGLDNRAKGSGHYFARNRSKINASLKFFPMLLFIDGVMFKLPKDSKMPRASAIRRVLKQKAPSAHSLSLRSLSAVELLASDS